MSFAPQQDWTKYHSLVETKQIERDRSRSAKQAHRRYAEIFDHVRATKNKDKPFRPAAQLEEKMALRAKLLTAFRLITGPTRE